MKKSSIGGWEEFEKRTGGSAYDKYDSSLAVIVAKGKKPSHLYLSKLALEKLGNPTHVSIHFNGTEIGFMASSNMNPNGYKLARSDALKDDSRQFINCRAVIVEKRLRPGAYTAYLHETLPNKLIVINANDIPSSV